MKAARSKTKAARPKAGGRIIDFLLVVVSLVVLIFIGSFALKFTQGESAPAPAKPTTGSAQDVVPLSVRMQILNGCGQSGVAGRFGKYLIDAARPDFVVDVIDERNFSSFNQEKTLLISRKAGSPVTERLAMRLGIPADQVTYKELEDNFLDIDYSIVVGADFEKYLSRRPGKT